MLFYSYELERGWHTESAHTVFSGKFAIHDFIMVISSHGVKVVANMHSLCSGVLFINVEATTKTRGQSLGVWAQSTHHWGDKYQARVFLGFKPFASSCWGYSYVHSRAVAGNREIISFAVKRWNEELGSIIWYRYFYITSLLAWLECYVKLRSHVRRAPGLRLKKRQTLNFRVQRLTIRLI